MRRGLADKMLTAVERFPDDAGQFARQVTYVPSSQPNVGYVLLQLHAPDQFKAQADYREKRQALLEIACGAAKNKFPDLTKVVGIAIDAPKHSNGMDGEDFILMECGTWTERLRSLYEELNGPWQFFGTEQMQQFNMHLTQFVPPEDAALAGKRATKIGRNGPCPCGSGKKYKKCHGA